MKTLNILNRLKLNTLGYTLDPRGKKAGTKEYEKYSDELTKFANSMRKKNKDLVIKLESFGRPQIFEVIKNMPKKGYPKQLKIGGIDIAKIVKELIDRGFIDEKGNILSSEPLIKNGKLNNVKNKV